MPSKVKIGIIGGSGLNNPSIFKKCIERKVTTIFGDPSDVLIEGEIEGVACVLLARHGRKHTISPPNVNYRANIWALKEIGCTHIIVSTATGSLQEEIKPGDLVIVDNFIDRTRTRMQTFYDDSQPTLKGVAHIPMEPAFCERTRNIIINTAKKANISIHEAGTVITIEGPRFSTKAESNLYRQWGAQLVNMTLVPEVMLAKEAGLCYGAIALATDYDCWRSQGDKVCVADVLATFKKNVEKVLTLIRLVVPQIAREDWDDTINELRETVQSSFMSPQ